ncbi:MAG: hypothetical protein ACTH0P_10890 [Candidatus Corynebacterium faecigallinarum]|uniref:hypothetical protein n=1 Tax=Candidatus Corynebacterium faecigallinarum TaxID=2838528 RepID=UPI003FB7790E
MRNTRARFSRVGIAAVALAPALAFAPVAGADEAESSAPSSSEDAASSLPGSGAEDAGATDNGNENDAPENGDDNDGEDAAGSVEGSLPEDIDTDELASSVADTDWTRVAKVIASLATGNVSIDTILDIIALSNDGDATVGDVIGSVTDVVGGSSDEGEDGEDVENGDDSDDADSEAPSEDAAE